MNLKQVLFLTTGLDGCRLQRTTFSRRNDGVYKTLNLICEGYKLANPKDIGKDRDMPFPYTNELKFIQFYLTNLS